MAHSDALRIGITCYPSVGGSGILATALGKDLAGRGHEVHFISYERPFRLPADGPRLHFHPRRGQRLRAVQISRLHPAALGAHGRSQPRSSAGRAARALRRAARDGRDPRALDAPARATALRRHDTARHGHDAARLRCRLRPGHQARPDQFGRGHDGVGVSEAGNPARARLRRPDRGHPQFLRAPPAKPLARGGAPRTRPGGTKSLFSTPPISARGNASTCCWKPSRASTRATPSSS